MRKLLIPEALRAEFDTVEAVWSSNGETRRVDALMLSWTKYEKQLRRLFSFSIFQHPNTTAASLESVISVFAANRNLNPETLISGIESLGVAPLSKLLGKSYKPLWAEIKRIKKYRNKIMHGQHTGQGVKSPQLEQDVIHIINWVSAVAQSAEAEFGYDGLKRKTYVPAKSRAKVHAKSCPFSTPEKLQLWLSTLKS